MEREITQAELIFSVLIRFSQISAVHYEPLVQSLRLVFVLEAAQLENFSGFRQRFKTHLSAFHCLRQIEDYHLDLKKSEGQKFSLLEVIRDVSTLSLEELNLITKLVLDYYGQILMEEGSEMDEEEQFEHNFLIEAGLSLGPIFGEEKLTGFRENGRVLVFSTPLAGVSRF